MWTPNTAGVSCLCMQPTPAAASGFPSVGHASRAGASGPDCGCCQWAVVATTGTAEPGEEVHLCAGSGHWRFCGLLVSFLLQLQPGGHLPTALQGTAWPLPVLLLDWLLQQLSEPCYLHHLQPGLPTCLSKDPLPAVDPDCLVSLPARCLCPGWCQDHPMVVPHPHSLCGHFPGGPLQTSTSDPPKGERTKVKFPGAHWKPPLADCTVG